MIEWQVNEYPTKPAVNIVVYKIDIQRDEYPFLRSRFAIVASHTALRNRVWRKQNDISMESKCDFLIVIEHENICSVVVSCLCAHTSVDLMFINRMFLGNSRNSITITLEWAHENLNIPTHALFILLMVCLKLCIVSHKSSQRMFIEHIYLCTFFGGGGGFCLRDQTWLCVYCWCQTPEDVVSRRRAITRVQPEWSPRGETTPDPRSRKCAC